MSEYVTLIGADDVRSAGHAMREAAAQMSRAAGNIDESLGRHQRFLDDWLLRLEAIMSEGRALENTP